MIAFEKLKIHPAYGSLKDACDVLPQQAASLLHAFCDLTSAQGWKNMKVEIFPTQSTHLTTDSQSQSKFAIIKGTPSTAKLDTDEQIVYPMSLHQPTNFQTLSNIFPSMGSITSKVLLAIVSSDGSIVYYELNEGIVSPKEVPE